MPWTFEPSDTTTSGFSNVYPVHRGDPMGSIDSIMATVSAEGGGGDTTVYSSPSGSKPNPVRWREGLTVEQAPAWWVGKTPTKITGKSRQASIINALIPYLSSEDQQNMATYLYQTYPNWFKEYGDITFQSGEPTLSTETKDWFSSTERAQRAAETLQQLASAVGRKENKMGAGYRFLQNYLDIIGQYSGTAQNRQTRQQYLEMSNALSSLIGGTEGTDAEAFSSIAQLLSNPTFTVGGSATEVSADTTTGNYYFGSGNPLLYG